MDCENEQYYRTLGAIYETAMSPQAWGDVCSEISRLIGAASARIHLVRSRQDSDNFRHEHAAPSNGNKPLIKLFEPIESFARSKRSVKSRDPATAHFLNRDILDTGEVRMTLECEFESELEIQSGSAAQWLDKILPHLARTARLQDARYLSDSERFTGIPFFDEWRQPAMLVALNGTVLQFNEATAQLLELTGLIRFTAGALALADAQERRILEECRRAAEETPVVRVLRLTESKPNAAQDVLYVFYHPVTSNHGRAALLTFYHPESPPIVDAGLLASAFDLTPAESRVACHIAEGRTPKEIAVKIGVQHDTVRKQLQAIYQKTSTNRQVDLIRLLLNLPAHPVGSWNPKTNATGALPE
jgi:DNA-binding CsgD family transcriptional regulator